MTQPAVLAVKVSSVDLELHCLEEMGYFAIRY